MIHSNPVLRPVSLLALLVAGCWASQAQGGDSRLADFSEVETIVSRHLNARRGYQPGDLISQSDWDAIQVNLGQAGWVPRDAAAVRKAMLPANDFLIGEARSKAGSQFIRRVSRYPGGLDRLDRLARMPYGVNTVRQLIRGPDGYKLFEYMTSTSGGASLGQMLSQDPGGKNFNQPTGRIYTAFQLLERLERSHAADFRQAQARSR